MQVTKELVAYAAELARIKLSEGETEKMRAALGAIIDYMDILTQVDTEGVEPLSHIFAVKNVMREDVVEPSYDRAALLKNAPERTEEYVVVPRTID